MALAVQGAGKLGEWLTTTDLVELGTEASLELPAIGKIDSLSDLQESDRSTVLQQMGQKLARCLKNHGKDETLQIDTFLMERSDKEKTQTYQYGNTNKIKWAKTFRFTVIINQDKTVNPPQDNDKSRNLLEPIQTSQEPIQNLLEPMEPITISNLFKTPYSHSTHPTLYISDIPIGSIGSIGSARHKPKTPIGSAIGSESVAIGSVGERVADKTPSYTYNKDKPEGYNFSGSIKTATKNSDSQPPVGFNAKTKGHRNCKDINLAAADLEGEDIIGKPLGDADCAIPERSTPQAPDIVYDDRWLVE